MVWNKIIKLYVEAGKRTSLKQSIFPKFRLNSLQTLQFLESLTNLGSFRTVIENKQKSNQKSGDFCIKLIQMGKALTYMGLTLL